MFAILAVTPAKAQTDTPQPIVRVLLFWMDGCPHCHYILDNVLPPLQEKYSDQLQITLIEVVSMEDFDRLYEVAARYGISWESVGVPFLIIGDRGLIGSGQIPAELPGLILSYLAEGGVPLPDIPEFSDLLPEESGSVSRVAAMVEGIFFTTPDCVDCLLIAWEVRDLAWDYDGQFTVETVDLVTSADIDYLYQVSNQFGLAKDEVDLPLFIIGDHILIGEEIPDQLPALIETYLQAGGVDRPIIPNQPENDKTSPIPSPHEAAHVSGFSLAILVMIGMIVVLLYSLLAILLNKTISLPPWTDLLIPILIVIGICVAGYLSYVETQSVTAICGPIGDCNTVQQSQYAKLFNFLPVGVLGLFGYIALLAAWLVRRFLPQMENTAAMAFWGMAFFAVLFSLYLTYLEPFVIKAVCIWCITSSVIATLLLLLGTSPVVRNLNISEGSE